MGKELWVAEWHICVIVNHERMLLTGEGPLLRIVLSPFKASTNPTRTSSPTHQTRPSVHSKIREITNSTSQSAVPLVLRLTYDMGVRDLNSRPPTPLSTDLSVGRCAGSGAEEVHVQPPHRRSRAPSLASIDQNQLPQVDDKGLSSDAIEANSTVPEFLTAHVASSERMLFQQQKQ